MPTKINNQKLPVNFYRGWNRKPEWSQLIRMAGDQAAILCNELRWHLGKLGDVREEIRYYGSELGWMPRYQFGRSTLCMVHMLPGKSGSERSHGPGGAEEIPVLCGTSGFPENSYSEDPLPREDLLSSRTTYEFFDSTFFGVSPASENFNVNAYI